MTATTEISQPRCQRPWGGRMATGTFAGFMRHRRAGETPCQPCLYAKRERNRAQVSAKRDRDRSCSLGT